MDNKLVPGMINGNPSVELLLAGRDIDAGAFYTENILILVSKSRKTIVIFSGNFCDTLIYKRHDVVCDRSLNFFTQVFDGSASGTSTFCWKRSTDVSGVAR